MTQTVIPCKRPKVTIATEAVASGPLAHRATCQVPGCSWAYGPAVKTDAEQQATWHRVAHRGAVPSARVVKDVEYDVYCEPCGGHRRTFGTRVDADAWLNYHLSTEHGLVTCP